MKYGFEIENCDVEDKETLKRYREKRTLWLDWLSGDEQHAIFPQISSMVWNDVTFRFLAHAASLDDNSALSNTLLAESLISGHFAMQTLAIRRLADKRKDVVSLRRLVTEMHDNRHFFTREIFVSYDGLPYDYASVENRIMLTRLGKKGPFWGAKTGPDANRPSEVAHTVFDDLCGVDLPNRKRTDQIPDVVFGTIVKWFDESDADDLVEWTHKMLAHAADAASRQRVNMEAVTPNLKRISATIKCFVRIAEAVSSYILFAGSQGNVLATPQFDKLEYLSSPVARSDLQNALEAYWETLDAERDEYLIDVLNDLTSSSRREPP